MLGMNQVHFSPHICSCQENKYLTFKLIQSVIQNESGYVKFHANGANVLSVQKLKMLINTLIEKMTPNWGF